MLILFIFATIIYLLNFNIIVMGTLACSIFVNNAELENCLSEYLSKMNCISSVDCLNNKFQLLEKTHQSYCDILFISEKEYDILHHILLPPFVIGIGNTENFAIHGSVFDVLKLPLDEQNICIVMSKILRIANAYRIPYRPVFEIPEVVSDTTANYHPNEMENNDYQMFIKIGKLNHRLVFDKILYIKNVGNTLKICLKDGESLFYRSTLKKIFNQLPPNLFARINKSVVINLKEIEKFQNQKVWIENECFNVSRIYIVRLRELLKVKLH